MRNINDINFLDSYDSGVEAPWKKYIVPICAGALLLLTGVYWFFQSGSVKALEEEYALKSGNLSMLESELSVKQQEVLELQQAEVAETGTEGDVIQDGFVDSFEVDFKNVADDILNGYSPLDEEILRIIGTSSPEGTFYSRYEVSGTGFVIEGYAQNTTSVANLSYNLRQHESIEDIDIQYLTLVTGSDSNASLAYDLYTFQLTGNLSGGDEIDG
ncbi:MAG: PilN domain-containing protein [Lachnospirales bacterium]